MTSDAIGWHDEEDLDDDVRILLCVVSEPENVTDAQKVRAVKQALQIRDRRIIKQTWDDVAQRLEAPLPPSLDSAVTESMDRIRNPTTSEASARALLAGLVRTLALELLARQREN